MKDEIRIMKCFHHYNVPNEMKSVSHEHKCEMKCDVYENV